VSDPVSTTNDLVQAGTAAGPDLASWGERLSFALVGSIIVVGTLAVLWLLTALLGRIFIAAEQKAAAAQAAKAAKAAAEAASQAPAPAAPEVPIAAIAAAVAVVLDKPHRIVAIQPSRAGANWAQVGRHQHFESHQLR
jgi:hypothetical protein